MLNTRQVRLGESATLSQNFIISTPAVPDGTMSIARENGTHVLDIDASGAVSFPQPSPMIVKAYCVFDGALSGTNAPISGFNVTSVTKLGSGQYNINFTTPFANNGYIVSVNADVASPGALALPYHLNSTASVLQVRTYNPTTLAGAEGGRIHVVVYKA